MMLSLTSKFSFLLLLILLMFQGCKEYFSYNYDAEMPNKTTRVYGKIRNLFTKEPVNSATVQLGVSIDNTDLNGTFQLYYVIGADEDLNKPVPISVTAINYYSYSSEIIIYPGDTEFNVDLQYAAPIIKKHYAGWHQSLSGKIFRVLQAEVLDYQGINTINSVQAIFFITDGHAMTEIYRNMTPVKQINDNTAFYQVSTMPKSYEPWQLLEGFNIEVEDKEGFSDIVSLLGAQTTPLFDPILP